MPNDDDQPVMAPAGPSIAVPTKFQLKNDTATAWKTFKQRFILYLLAGGYNKRPENEKVAVLLCNVYFHFRLHSFYTRLGFD